MDTTIPRDGECGESGACIMASMISDLKHFEQLAIMPNVI